MNIYLFFVLDEGSTAVVHPAQAQIWQILEPALPGVARHLAAHQPRPSCQHHRVGAGDGAGAPASDIWIILLINIVSIVFTLSDI